MATDENGQQGRVIKTWAPPVTGVRPADGSSQEMNILFRNLPKAITVQLQNRFDNRLGDLCELYLQLGQIPEAIFADPCTGATRREDISSARKYCIVFLKLNDSISDIMPNNIWYCSMQ